MGFFISVGIFFVVLLITLIAEIQVKTTFEKYAKKEAKSGIKGFELARKLLDEAGLYDVEVVNVSGNLTDYYDHKSKKLALSDSTYNSSSIASLGVVGHEVGHAIQYKDEYVPIKIRNGIIPVSNFISRMTMPLLLIGFILAIFIDANIYVDIFIYIGVAVYGVAVLFDLATLPTEINASQRSVKLLATTGVINEEEMPAVKKVLTAAALTYLASLIVSALYLFRFLWLAKQND